MMDRKILVFGCSLIAAGSVLAGRLPPDAEATYMEVPSLTARYGQYIDTGYSVPANAELRFKFTMTKTATYQCPFGTYTDANTLCTRLARNSNDANNYLVYFRSNANNGWILISNVTASESDVVEGYMNASKVKLNAQEVAFKPETGGAFVGAADGKTLLLFTQKADAAPKPVTIYSFSILEGGETKHDYVPCCRRSDGKTGFYDVVDMEFLPTQFGTHASAQPREMTFGNDRLEIVGSPTAKGTVTPAYGVQEGLTNGQILAVSAPAHLVGIGTCTCCAGYNLYTNVPGDASAWGLWKRGSENSFTYVHPATASVRLEWVWNEYTLPDGCQPLQWLKSDGGQFVNTDYKANVKTFYRFKYAMKPVGYSGPFVTYTGPTVNCTRIIASNNGLSTRLLAYFLSSGQDGWMELPGVTKNVGEDVSGFLAYDKVQLNGVTYPLTCREPSSDRPTRTGSEDTHTAYLFRVNTGTGAEVTMYAFAIFEDNVLLHDYLPCERNGKGVMVDLVTGVVLENGGTGDFICGPEDHPGDATVYSWKASVTEGDWTNAANWTAEGPAEVGYPAGSLSTAKFPTGTRATVRLPERALTFKTLSLKETDLKVKFVGGVRDSTGAFQNVMTAIVSEGVSESVAAGTAQNNEIIFDGVAVSSPEYLVVGVGSRLVLTNAAEFTCGKGVMMGYGTGAVLPNPTAGYLDVRDGSLLKVAKEIDLASQFVLTIDDARVQAESVQFGFNTPGGTVRLAGTHPEMLLTVCVRNVTAGDEGGFLFQLPADGYGAPPVRTSGDGNELNCFGGPDDYFAGKKIRIDVEPAFAPETCCRKSRNPLVTAISGVNVNTVIFDNRTGCPGNFLYGEELQEPYGWHAVSEFPAGQKPKSIGIYLPRGLMLILK